MRKLIIAITMVFASLEVHAVGIGNVFGALMAQSGGLANETSVDQALAKVSVQLNKKTPMNVDSNTRLDKVSAEPGQQLTYHYTLISVRSTDVDTAEFHKMIKPELKNRLCQSTEMQNFLKNGVTVAYLYRGSDGRAIGAAKFAPSECGYKS